MSSYLPQLASSHRQNSCGSINFFDDSMTPTGVNKQPRSQWSPCSLFSRWRTLQGYPWSMLACDVIITPRETMITWQILQKSWSIWSRGTSALTRVIPGASANLKIANRENSGIEVEVRLIGSLISITISTSCKNLGRVISTYSMFFLKKLRKDYERTTELVRLIP